MSERIYLLSLWIRLWHWTNALLIIMLTITGISLYNCALYCKVLIFELE